MTAQTSTLTGGSRKGIAPVLAVMGLAALLAACAQRPVDPMMTTSIPDDYRVAHPILIEDKVATMDVPVSAGAGGLQSTVRSNIGFFAQSFLASGARVIAVVAPSGSPNQTAAARAAGDVERALIAAGVPREAISYRVYRASPLEQIAPVRLAYTRITATTAPCGPWVEDVGNSTPNRNYRAFGCSTQQNLAAAVENPLDLLYPRGLTPADAARRAVVLQRYRAGEPVTSADTLTGGTAAQVGQ